MIFPTGKPHVSFSEIKNWKECPHRHRLLYIDKLETWEDNPYADFGTIIHDQIENYLKGNGFDIEKAKSNISTIWEQKEYDSPSYIEKVTKDRASFGSKYVHDHVDFWYTSAENILSSFPEWLDETFPGWEYVSAEEQLYEDIDKSELKFKGFIDCIIKTKKGKKDVYWVIDWKSTGKAGWWYKKRRDFLTLSQIGFYKSYWAKKNNIPLSQIRTAFAFLKRGAEQGECIELFPVSAGPKFVEKTDKLLQSMIFTVNRGFFPKNPDNCKFCSFKNTEHCDAGW
tara:strand:- start:275 stop:1123 length:849 start_codon:yes stop_codon:yes gene_type:complete